MNNTSLNYSELTSIQAPDLILNMHSFIGEYRLL